MASRASLGFSVFQEEWSELASMALMVCGRVFICDRLALDVGISDVPERVAQASWQPQAGTDDGQVTQAETSS